MDLNALGYQSPTYCNVAILLMPVVTKDRSSHLSPFLSPRIFLSGCKFSTRAPLESMVGFHLLTFARFLSATEARIKEVVLSRIELTTPHYVCSDSETATLSTTPLGLV